MCSVVYGGCPVLLSSHCHTECSNISAVLQILGRGNGDRAAAQQLKRDRVWGPPSAWHQLLRGPIPPPPSTPLHHHHLSEPASLVSFHCHKVDSATACLTLCAQSSLPPPDVSPTWILSHPSCFPLALVKGLEPAHSSHSTIYSLLHPNWTSWQSIFLFLSFWRPFLQVHLMTSIFQPSLMGFWEMLQSSEDVWMCMFFFPPLTEFKKKLTFNCGHTRKTSVNRCM